jgi:hypothetical protein
VYLVRGNHETSYCTGIYGFQQELSHKYPGGEHKASARARAGAAGSLLRSPCTAQPRPLTTERARGARGEGGRGGGGGQLHPGHVGGAARWDPGSRRADVAGTAAPALQSVYTACKAVFSHLPLAALVAGTTLVLHGGEGCAPGASQACPDPSFAPQRTATACMISQQHTQRAPVPGQAGGRAQLPPPPPLTGVRRLLVRRPLPQAAAR